MAPRITGPAATPVAPLLVTNECKCEPVVHCTSGVDCVISAGTTAKELVITGVTGGATGAIRILPAAPLPSGSTVKES